MKAPTTDQKPIQRPAVRSYSKILVGYDGSENARRALATAELLASAIDASLRILVVVNTVISSYGPVAPSYPDDYPQKRFEDANKLLAQAIDSCDDPSNDVSGLVKEGYPPQTILKVAKDQNTDLIVLGRRGISGVQRFLMGSVSSAVVGHSTCDVLIVK